MPRNLKTEERTKKPVRANALSLLGLGDVDLLTRSLERVANNSAISSTGDGTRTNMDNEFKPSGLDKHVLVPVRGRAAAPNLALQKRRRHPQGLSLLGWMTEHLISIERHHLLGGGGHLRF